jgi:Kef-type K+ transport system membrane component KefB
MFLVGLGFRTDHFKANAHRASLGTLSLAAGAIDDAAAWCVLAVVLASFGASNSGVDTPPS